MGFLSTLRRGVRHAALRRGVFIGRVTAPGAPESADAHLSFLLSRLGVNCVLDVGAHTGEFAGRLRELGYGGRIVSFEPVSGHFAALNRRMAGDANWMGRPMALGARDGQAQIQVSRSSTFSSFLRPSAYGAERFRDDLAAVSTEVVEVRRLDGVWDDCLAGVERPVVLLKIDTQGFDWEVIAGAGACIERVDAIQTEISIKAVYDGMTTGLADSLARLKALGFDPTSLTPVARDPVDHVRLIEMDCLVVRSSALAARTVETPPAVALAH